MSSQYNQPTGLPHQTGDNYIQQQGQIPLQQGQFVPPPPQQPQQDQIPMSYNQSPTQQQPQQGQIPMNYNQPPPPPSQQQQQQYYNTPNSYNQPPTQQSQQQGQIPMNYNQPPTQSPIQHQGQISMGYNQPPTQQSQQQGQIPMNYNQGVQYNNDGNQLPNIQNLSISNNNPNQYINQQQQQPPMMNTFVPSYQQGQIPQQQQGQIPMSYNQSPTQQQQQQQQPNYNNMVLPQNIQAQQQQQQQAPRIAPSQIPSSTAILEQYKSYIYKTNQEPILPPPSSVSQFCIDQQNARPNFMRSTMYTIPENEDILNQTHIPFVIHTTPFAALNHPSEMPIPQIVHPGSPVQCKRCHAYSNPFNLFTNGGRYFICRFCEFENTVEKEYFSAVLPNGLRTDFEQRPELQFGSYEFLLSTPVPPQLPAYVFVIEISQFTIQNGIVQVVIESLRRMFNNHSSSMPSRIGIITYDTEVHFWSFKKTYTQPQMKVLSKSQVFVPIEDGFLVNYQESKTLIDHFFDNILNFFRNPPAISRDFAFGAAVQSASLALEKCGGRVSVFTSNLPKGTPGNIERREKTLSPSSPASSNFYKPVAAQCVKMNVSVDIFCLPAEVCDLPTSAQLSALTGGQLYCYPNYLTDLHSDQLAQDIIENHITEFGINATAKVRCSSGITAHTHFGHFSTVQNEIQLAGVSQGKTISTLIKYDDKLKPKAKAYIQFAMIYVNLKGETRIRVHNLRLNTDSAFVSYFKDADLDSIITYLARVASRDIAGSGPSNIRTSIVDKSVDILASYRKNCAADKSPSQLILPELFKLLPLYILSMMKTPPFRLSVDISPDLRYFYQHLYTSLAPSKIIPLIYPRMYPLHHLQAHEGLLSTTAKPDHIVLPVFQRLCADQIAQNGIYLVDDGRSLVLWVQQFASQHQLKQLFDNETIVGFNNQKLYQLYQSQRSQNEYHQRVDNIVSALSQLRGHPYRSLQFSQSTQSDPLDSYLKSIFYEDKGVDSISYVDFLCQVHKQIQNKLS
ncbi:putative transport protein [Tieghemostelium lacteum]|uniref:Putative transport protein n=1 Tax=Tieghemostelium lacteum TaxID=361077 RepID=A0A151ZIT2_TIELA|nr:putative transport protein [Tieghemostelium lacteum]|eukprot:KYQ93908.1 putative transport protein [Tieghemostelium lacteum]